jgi:hypothetical protein
MKDITPEVSLDTVSLLYKNPLEKVLSGMHTGPMDLQFSTNSWLKGDKEITSRIYFDPNYRSLPLFHSYFYSGRTSKKYFVRNSGGKPIAKWTNSCDSWWSMCNAGMNRHRRRHDQSKLKTLNFVIDQIKSDENAHYRFNKTDIAIDIWTDPDITLDHFFPLKFAKTGRINLPSEYYVSAVDGSRTFYIEMKTPAGNKCIVRSYLYEKDMKEGLYGDKRLFRFEVSVGGLQKVGDDPEKLIKRLKNVLKQYRLFLFDDVRSCRKLKKQYAENIRNNRNRKNQSPNVPKKLLGEIEESAAKVSLELTDDIESWIYNSLDKTTRADPLQFKATTYPRRKVNHDRIKNCRIRRFLRQRWEREGRERPEIRERRNKQGIRAIIAVLQQSEPAHFQLDELNLEGGQVFNKQDFFVYATGPPYLLYQSSLVSCG